MEEKNNFKKVYETEAPDELRNNSLKNAQGSVRTVKSIFDVLDLYISKFFGAIIHSFKDNSSNHLANTGLAAGVGLIESELEEEEEGDSENSDDIDVVS